jgi:hypothetical protein
MNGSDRIERASRIEFKVILDTLRKRNFAVLSTIDGGPGGAPHSAGVNYGVSPPGREFSIYVMIRRHLRKARNIARNPNVSLLVPVTRRLLWFLPPPCIQVRGRAEILDWTDDGGRDVFQRFWMGRRILRMYEASHRRGETRICFLRIMPDPVISSYMVGHGVWELRRRMESGLAKAIVPPEHRAQENREGPQVSSERPRRHRRAG